MPHNCLRYWGNQADALRVKLAQGEAANPGSGWARHLADRDAYDALVELHARLFCARHTQSQKLTKFHFGAGGNVSVDGLLEATCNMIGGLEADRLSEGRGTHSPSLSDVNWHKRGAPDPDSIPELKAVKDLIRRALKP